MCIWDRYKPPNQTRSCAKACTPTVALGEGENVARVKTIKLMFSFSGTWPETLYYIPKSPEYSRGGDVFVSRSSCPPISVVGTGTRCYFWPTRMLTPALTPIQDIHREPSGKRITKRSPRSSAPWQNGSDLSKNACSLRLLVSTYGCADKCGPRTNLYAETTHSSSYQATTSTSLDFARRNRGLFRWLLEHLPQSSRQSTWYPEWFARD